ncbi:holo-ACP synthase [Oceanivirga salmonicida]|uniref:holo-ACP synthase n=1 Tax=Oceanivirga salmonicida TaxID=1769291 RepID=UPI0008352CFB|nr:holo-ACP synthase [Oceanivirga salmonicida]
MEIGVDIVSVERIKKALSKDGFREKIYTENEIKYCESRKNKFESYACRFAAKEAFSKAMGTGFRGNFNFLDIEIKNNDMGKPYIKYKQHKVKLSISHEKDYAIATVLLEEEL